MFTGPAPGSPLHALATALAASVLSTAWLAVLGPPPPLPIRGGGGADDYGAAQRSLLAHAIGLTQGWAWCDALAACEGHVLSRLPAAWRWQGELGLTLGVTASVLLAREVVGGLTRSAGARGPRPLL